MNIIKNKRLSLSVAMIAVFIAGTFTSCLNDKNEERYDHSPALVSFQYTGNAAEVFTASLLGNPQDSFDLEVTLSVASITLSSTVTATLAPYQNGLDSFNNAGGTAYDMLPAADYTIPNNATVTISPGQQIVATKISFAGDKIDFTKDYALVLQIASASGATIASNLNTAVIVLKLKNPYEGDYHITGFFVHPSAPRAVDQDGTISTVSLNTSLAPLGDLAGYNFDFDTDPNTGVLSNWVPEGNTPGVPSIGGSSGFLYVDNAAGSATYPGPPYTSANYPNVYKFDTQTFWMHYGYNAQGGTIYTREVYESYQRQ
jgi:Domain of unknown function (DUF1735)